MTDNEIIARLECCANGEGCESCPCSKQCDGAEHLTYAIDLINRQKAEIERLKETPKCVYAYDGETMEYCAEGPCPNFKTAAEIRAEAIKEFAKRLKGHRKGNYIYISTEWLDNHVKEMVGEK